MATVTNHKLPGPAVVGGARVKRPMTVFGLRLLPGYVMTAEEVNAIPHNNRLAMISNGYIEVWSGVPEAEKTKRFVISLGFGKYDVIEGRKLNDGAMTKDEANALAGIATLAEEAA